MFDGRGGPVASADLRDLVAALAETSRVVSDAERIEQIQALEEVKAAAAAAQVRATADLDASVRARHAALGLPRAKHGMGVGSQVALARRVSPSQGGRHVGLATALVREMPHTLVALTAGWLSEWRATILVRETACLSAAHRAQVDRELVGPGADGDAAPRALQLGDRALGAEARRLAYRLDPHAALRRARKAEGDRTVSLRPAPDTMTYLTGLLPVAHGVAAWAALNKEADTARAAGDSRTRGQVMADTLFERITGQALARREPEAATDEHATDEQSTDEQSTDEQSAAASSTGDPALRGPAGPAGPRGPAGPAVGIEVQLVITDRALFLGEQEPAWITGYGPVPAGLARELVLDGLTTRCATAPGAGDVAARAEVWLRRLFTHPGTGQLVAMESRSRAFPKGLRDFLVARDQTCRTPWCDAPVRHADHAREHAGGGATDADNGQGLCEGCNYTKTAPGWSARPGPGTTPGDHQITTTTPTGHAYTSRPPPQPGHSPPDRSGDLPTVGDPPDDATGRAPGHASRHDSWVARHLTLVEPGPVELVLAGYLHGPAA